LRSLVSSPEGISIVLRVARECQLSREVVAKLLCKIDTKSKAPFSEPLMPPVGTRLNQLSARKRAPRLRKDWGHGRGEDGGAGGAAGNRWSVGMSKLKRQRKRQSDAEITGENGAGGKRRRRAKQTAGGDSVHVYVIG